MEFIEEVDVDLGLDRAKSNDVDVTESKPTSTQSHGDATLSIVDEGNGTNIMEDCGAKECIALAGDPESEMYVALNAVLTSSDLPSSRATTSRRRRRLPIVLSRTLARLVDLSWEIALVWLALRITVPIDTMSVLSSALIIFLAIPPMALTLDSLVQGVFGNTPGKRLLGIQAVTWRGRQLSLRESFERNFLVWRFGFLFGIMPLAPFTALRQWHRVLKGNRTHYDERLHLRTKGYERPFWMSILAAGIAITALSLPLCHLLYGKPSFSAAGTRWWNFTRQQVDSPVKLSTETASVLTSIKIDVVPAFLIEGGPSVNNDEAG